MPKTRQGEREDSAAQVRQVRTLQTALDQAQESDACARNGCRLERTITVGEARRQSEYDAKVAPWRHPEWDHPAVRALRAKLTEQVSALDRLREENGLLRRWVSQRVDQEQPGMAGA